MEDGAMEGVKGEFRGRCEKIDLQRWSEFGAKKSRSRLLLNLDLGPSARTPGLKSETWATRQDRTEMTLTEIPPVSCGNRDDYSMVISVCPGLIIAGVLFVPRSLCPRSLR